MVTAWNEPMNHLPPAAWAFEQSQENVEEGEVLNVALAKYYFLDFKVAP
jgi:hypothetical protein